MRHPPLLPEETLARVLRLARLDGLSVVMFATVFALMTASNGERDFAVIGLLGAAAGALELHGAALLRQGDSRGMRWITMSPPFLLLVIYGYCFLRLTNFEMPPIPESLQDRFAESARQLNMTVEQAFEWANRLTARIVAIVATIYQGWLMFYYLRRRRTISQALDL